MLVVYCLAFNSYDLLSFEEAKAGVRKITCDVDDSRNLGKEKEAKGLSPTVAQLAEWLLKESVLVHCKPRTEVGRNRSRRRS